MNEELQGLHRQIQALREEVLRLHEQAMEAAIQASQNHAPGHANLQAQINQLQLDLQKYREDDRYTLTRAQVMKALNEAKAHENASHD